MIHAGQTFGAGTRAKSSTPVLISGTPTLISGAPILISCTPVLILGNLVLIFGTHVLISGTLVTPAYSSDLRDPSHASQLLRSALWCL